ncbi:hypothetical protein KP509_09G025200 [Ceratopteris richardii]|nr:hypothetical protein KP509_09G025200 [Ceratopteris richardii]
MQLVRELGEEVVAYKHCDVSEESDVQSLVAFTIAKWGKLDIMHNNAGILSATRSKEVSTMDMNDFDRVMSVNTRGMALGVKHASKVMIEAKVKGSIICTCSVAGIKGGTSTVAYTVSKHAVVGLMRAAASDLAKYGIRVNCLSPAGMVTPLVMKTLQQMKPSVTEKEVQKAFDEVSIFRGHSLSPLDIAQGALYLASDEAAFISGHNLIIDGGRTATLAPISV